MADSLLAEVTRNGFVECRHYGSVAVVGPSGEVCFAAGEPDRQIFGRSANKMMQAVAMLRAGLQVTGEQLALATASHSGGAAHLSVVHSILKEANLSPGALQNTPMAPLGKPEYDQFIVDRQEVSALTMNCSGKHAAMLSTCVRCDWELDSYLANDHPLQVRITETIEEFTGDLPEGIGVDGCGAPAHRVSVVGLARSLARMTVADATSPEGRVIDAIRAYPALVGGHGRDVTEFLFAAPGWVGKDGADGVMVLASPDGFSVAVKIVDGAERPRIPVAIAALEQAGVPVPTLPDTIRRPLVLGGGKPVGDVHAAIGSIR
jgi:L-asparaginase II